MVKKRASADLPSTRPLLDKLGVKPGSKIAIVNLEDAGFIRQLKERTSDIVTGKPRSKVDLVFVGAQDAAGFRRLDELKTWIQPNCAICAVLPTDRPHP